MKLFILVFIIISQRSWSDEQSNFQVEIAKQRKSEIEAQNTLEKIRTCKVNNDCILVDSSCGPAAINKQNLKKFNSIKKVLMRSRCIERHSCQKTQCHEGKCQTTECIKATI